MKTLTKIIESVTHEEEKMLEARKLIKDLIMRLDMYSKGVIQNRLEQIYKILEI